MFTTFNTNNYCLIHCSVTMAGGQVWSVKNCMTELVAVTEFVTHQVRARPQLAGWAVRHAQPAPPTTAQQNTSRLYHGGRLGVTRNTVMSYCTRPSTWISQADVVYKVTMKKSSAMNHTDKLTFS